MQLALEALEKVIIAFGSGLTLQQNAITALRQALEIEQEPVAWHGPTAWQCQCGKPYTVTCISSKPKDKNT
jgi:hypothetical protein